MPSRNALSNYRYAFQGQEIDQETGMEAFQLRLWDGRIGRWLSTDPYGQYNSPYLGMGNNPLSGIDSDGGWFFKFWANYKRNQVIRDRKDPSAIMYSDTKGYYFNLSSTQLELTPDGFETGLTITSVSSNKGLDNYGWTPQISAHKANFFENIETNYLNSMKMITLPHLS